MELISKEQAIDALRTCYDTETITMDNGDEYINYGDAVGEIEQLPPIQPKITHCRDCKHWIFDGVMVCERFTDASLKGDDFCSYGERI